MSTATTSPAPAEVPPAGPGAVTPAPAGKPSGPARRRTVNPVLQVPGTALSILSLVALCLVFHLTLVSQLRYERDQQTALADFRGELARGTAPVGQFRVDFGDGGESRERLVEPGSPVAVLSVPRIGLRTVVFEGTSASVLRSGPGHRRDTVLPGQRGTSVIMARRAAYGGPFRDLDLVLPGDTVTVTTGQGEQAFVVTGLRRPGDPVPPVADPAGGRLTLITALGPEFMPTDILRVDAQLSSPVQPTPARRFGATALPQAEQAMATDSGAWTVVMLWGQALFLAALALAYLRGRWGSWQVWIVGTPVLLALGLAAADQVVRLLPNLL
ncbi:sortase [Micromonospora sp. NPDC047548]|uniref:sortase n=1 Tax=Micromonospora sp. NPDC047548 TaxID=3155624 RepID=UPI0033C8217F